MTVGQAQVSCYRGETWLLCIISRYSWLEDKDEVDKVPEHTLKMQEGEYKRENEQRMGKCGWVGSLRV